MRWLPALLDLLLPRRCGVCGCVLLRNERHICLKCLMEFPQTYFWTQEKNPMADKLNSLIDYGGYSYGVALYHYTGGYRELSMSLKYRGELPLGRYVAGILGRKLSQCDFLSDVDAVIPVPLHRRRQFHRGYNQAEVIAAEVASVLGCPLVSDVLYRKRNTASQAGLDTSQKAGNVAGAFRVKNSERIRDARHILLIDDVFTTGSTLATCHKALHDALCGTPVSGHATHTRISVATLAYAGK